MLNKVINEQNQNQYTVYVRMPAGTVQFLM